MCVMTRLEECYWIFENVEFDQDRKMSRITYISEQRWNVGVRGSAAAGPAVGKGFGVEQRNCRGLISSAGHQRGSSTGGRWLQPGTCWASLLVSIQKLSFLSLSVPLCFSTSASSSTIKEQEISTPRKNGQAEVPACVHCPRSLLASEMRRRQVLMGEKPNPQQTEALWSAVTAKHSNVSLFLAGRIQKSCCIYCCSLLWSAGTGSPARRTNSSKGKGWNGFKVCVENPKKCKTSAD